AATWLSVDRTANSADTAAFQVAITATSFGGIASGDLLSKIAIETISGVYTHTEQLIISNTGANRLNLTGLSVGSDVIGLPAAAGIRNTTNQGGVGFYCDSSLLLHAGDNITAMLSDLGITATDTKENIYLTADGFIDVWSNRQTSFAASEHFQFRADGGFQVFVPTGTAPLVVASTTLVANLNADLLDGQSGAFYTNAVDTVFGRTGAILALESDYNAFYITDNAISTLTAQLTIGTLGSIKWNTAINAFWGSSQEASILFTAGNWIMSAPLSGEFQLNMGSEKMIQMFANSRVRIFHDNAIRLDTTADGIDIEGGGISIAEFAAAPVDRTGRGFYWARTDNTPMFTTEAGVDIDLSSGGDVNATGTPLNDQVAIWTNATTIEGDPNLIFDTTGLTVLASEIRVENSSPRFVMRDTDSLVDEKVYRFQIIAGILTGDMFTDDELSSKQWLLVDRSGNTPTEVGIRGGANFRVYGPNNVDYIEFDHDNTDLNTNFVGTVDWNITGLTGNVVFGGPIWGDVVLSLLERTSAPADTSLRGQFWVRDDAPGQTPMFTTDAGTDIDLSDTGGGGGMSLTRISATTGAAGADLTWHNRPTVFTKTNNTLGVAMSTTGVGVGVWKFKYTVIYQSSNLLTGVQFAIGHTGTVTEFAARWSHATTGKAATTGVGDDQTGVSGGVMMEVEAGRVLGSRLGSSSVGVQLVDADILVVLEGIIVVSVTGTLQLQFANETGASAVRLQPDMLLELMKIE
ncbi:MAG: hypothetical protein V3S69_06055, partial [Dehalococcoidales bacterium]